MTVKFWGVRGSMPVPGESTLRYGGNTSCVSVEFGDRLLIIDAGTGVRALGSSLQHSKKEIYLLLSHVHNDHIQGFPFFAPLYEPDRALYVLDYRRDDFTWSPLHMLDGVHMPVRCSDLPSRPIRVRDDAISFLREHGIDIDRQIVNHPGGAYGYRVTHRGGSFVHIPDNELDPPGVSNTSFEAFTRFCQNADVLCHDAQYLSNDMPFKWGWGHSMVHRVCELAIAANIKHLILFHHDPARDDASLDKIQEMARTLLATHDIACTAAHEGLSLNIGDKV